MYKYEHAHKLSPLTIDLFSLFTSLLKMVWTCTRPSPRHYLFTAACPRPSLSPAQTRITSATFHSRLKPQGQLHSWAQGWAAPCLPAWQTFTITNSSSLSLPHTHTHTQNPKRNTSFSQFSIKLCCNRNSPVPAPLRSFTAYTMRLDRSGRGHNNSGSR